MADRVMQAARAASPKEGRQYRLESGVSSEVFVTPDTWKGRFVELAAIGASVAVVFGNHSDLTASLTAQNTSTGSGTSGSPHVLTAGDTIGRTLFDGEAETLYIDENDTHFAVIAASAETVIEARIVS